MPREKEREFEEGLKRLLIKAKGLEDRFSLEEKLILVPPNPMPLDDRSIGFFPPGIYLKNLSGGDFSVIDILLDEWKHYVNLGIESYSGIIRKYAGVMDSAYGFLMLRYKPLIFLKPDKKQFDIKCNEDKNTLRRKEEIEKANQQFSDYFRKEIEEMRERIKQEILKNMDKMLEEMKKARQQITEEEIEGYKKELYKGDKEEIEKLKKQLQQGYSQEPASRLFDIWGKEHEDEFLVFISEITKAGKR